VFYLNIMCNYMFITQIVFLKDNANYDLNSLGGKERLLEHHFL